MTDRLHIAAILMSGLLAKDSINKKDRDAHVSESLRLADALIATERRNPAKANGWEEEK